MGLCTPAQGYEAPANTTPGSYAQQGKHQEQQQVQPCSTGDPYEVIRVPRLPDLSHASAELQVFREQCAAGVRQAVAMVTAMEHQLWWERSRRQQAEEDVKVLLAAVDAERDLASSSLQDAANAVQQAREEATGGALVIRAAELPDASKAATVIQKNYRGHAARKDFEDHLKTILRGIDPDLDPSLLPATAQHHISAVNVASNAGKNGKGVRATLQGMQLSNPPMMVPEGKTGHLRQQVDTIKRRMDRTADAGMQVHDPALDTQLDLKRILQGNLPASSATVIAALVRRCKELQAALIESCQDLQQCRMAEQGLRAQNMQVVQLSQVRWELEEERLNRQALQQQVAKLQHALAQAAPGRACAAKAHAHINPYMAAWYRRQYAAGDFMQYASSKGSAGPGAQIFAGADAEVEHWDDLRACAPDPILIPALHQPQRHYHDLLALHADCANGAGKDVPNPLYTSSVPDTSQFKYARDTPIMPVSTTAPLVQKAALAPATTAFPPGQLLQPGTIQPPMVPVYSTLPLLREDTHIAAMSRGGATLSSPSPGTPQPIRLADAVPGCMSGMQYPVSQQASALPVQGYASGQQQYGSAQQYSMPAAQHGTAQQYNGSTGAPAMTVLSNLPLLRESSGGYTVNQGQPPVSYSGSTPALTVRSPLSLMRESTAGIAANTASTCPTPTGAAPTLLTGGLSMGTAPQLQQVPGQVLHGTMSSTASSTANSQGMSGSISSSPARTNSLAAQLSTLSGTKPSPQYANPPNAAFSFQ